MLSQFALILIFAVFAALFIFASLVAGSLLRPKNPNPVKEEPYECGEPAVGKGWINFNMRFYLIALIFVIFDVEAALMFPVAVVFKKWISAGFGWLAFFEIGIFVAILAVGLVYVWVKRDLEWIKTVTSGQ